MSQPTCKVKIGDNDQELALEVGQSILEAAMAVHFDIEHACGGVCACSTCHVKVVTQSECFSEASEEELDQLDEARDVDLDSRLACQARLTRIPDSGEIEVTIPNWNVNAVKEGH